MRLNIVHSMELDDWIRNLHYLHTTPAGAIIRMFFIDETEPFVESKSLAMARKFIRKNFPKIKGLVAYSSTGEGHEGIVYQADG